MACELLLLKWSSVFLLCTALSCLIPLFRSDLAALYCSITLLQQDRDLFSQPKFLVGIHPETFFHKDTVDTEVYVEEH